MRDDDLRTEIQFHIDKRAERHVKAGMTPDEADALARQQFGDVEAAMKGMRLARMRSPKAALIALTITSLVIAVLWVAGAAIVNAPMAFPEPPAVPVQVKAQKRPPPPPPGPGPTWAEFVAKVNTFGDGKKSANRPH
jgi:hypothetical protein